MGNQRPIKVCLICGDKAFAFNFGVISCQSCKAFFRRNALKNKVFECAFENNCTIDKNTRKFCQRCRLDKCFRVGMKKEWILNEEQLEVIKTKILHNRLKRNSQNECNTNDLVTKSVSKRVSKRVPKKCGKNKYKKSNNTFELVESPLSDPLAYSPSNSETSDNELIGDKNSDNSDNDNKTTKNKITIDGYISTTKSSDLLSVYGSYNRDQLEDFQNYVVTIGQHVRDFVALSLSEGESHKLLELFNAVNFIREPRIPNRPVITDCMNLKVAMVSKLDREIQRFICVAQNVNEFEHQCHNDRIALIKYGVIEIMCMRLIQFYNFDAQQWTLFMDKNKWILSKLDQLRSNSLKRGFRTGFAKIGEAWDSDPIIIDLLTAILLFDPNRPNLAHSDCIKLQQNIYMYLLQRYLLVRHKSESKAKTKFLNLMNGLIDINSLGKAFTHRCYLTNPNDLGPILREILDVKVVSESN